jgi:L,D-transpeptidase YcbB
MSKQRPPCFPALCFLPNVPILVACKACLSLIRPNGGVLELAISAPLRRALSCLLALSLGLGGTFCLAQTAPQTAQPKDSQSAAVSAQLEAIGAAGKLSDLRWPNFADYRQHFQRVYQASNGAPIWLQDGQPTPQALEVIRALDSSRLKGLNPDDYDASRWSERLNGLKSASGNADIEAHFDAALTVCTMRYISDLHIGRVNPKHFDFGVDIQQKKYDLPLFLTQEVIHSPNVQTVFDEAEPPYAGYRRTEAALQRYIALAAQGDGSMVPAVTKTVAPNTVYSGISQLRSRLELLGDLPKGVIENQDSQKYDGSLVDAVKHFQNRHGLAADGNLSQETIRQLNIPLAVRVDQLCDALERWRWLPPQFPQPPVVVNIPEFVLRVFTADHEVALRMNVVVGKSVRHQTPVFARDMKFIVLRPYWNVPPSILRGEILPAIVKDRSYLARKNFEVTDSSGRVITDGAVSDEVLGQLRAGKLMVRQKPGPSNSLGLVKFMFPNEHNVYLHSTPAPELFARSRRDFSHGCIRVEKPAELAAFLLRNQPPWTLAKVQVAMQSGPNNQQVNLVAPIPVLILYITAVAEEDGSVHFFDDIYGHDKRLNAVLAKGLPYPG